MPTSVALTPRFESFARDRCAALISFGLRDLADDPARPGVSARTEISSGLFSYHLRFSRRRAATGLVQVEHPRHLVTFRIATDGAVEIVRLLHDAMDFDHHVPRD